MYNYSRIRGKIKEIFGTQEAFSKAIGLSATTISDKLNHKVEWTQKEMEKTMEVFGMPVRLIPLYFFCNETQELEKTANPTLSTFNN